MNIRISSVHFDADQKLLDYIQQKFGKLDNYFDRITDCQVTLRLEPTGQIQDKIVECKLLVPGDTLVVKEMDKTFEAAVDKASDIMKRSLRRYKEKLQAHQ